jgi:hypothetical protein
MIATFLYIFLWIIATLATNKNSYQKQNTDYYPSGKNLPKKNRVELRA